VLTLSELPSTAEVTALMCAAAPGVCAAALRTRPNPGDAGEMNERTRHTPARTCYDFPPTVFSGLASVSSEAGTVGAKRTNPDAKLLPTFDCARRGWWRSPEGASIADTQSPRAYTGRCSRGKQHRPAPRRQGLRAVEQNVGGGDGRGLVLVVIVVCLAAVHRAVGDDAGIGTNLWRWSAAHLGDDPEEVVVLAALADALAV